MPQHSPLREDPAARSFLGATPDAPRRGPIRGFFRRLARELVWPFVALMALGHRFGRTLLRTEHVVEGGCKMRGACCHHILFEWWSLFDRYPILGRIALWKLTRFYSFFDRGYSWEVQDGLLVRVLGCHALREDGLCGEHRTRPLFCRTYPEVPLVGRPMVLRGCGYRFSRRDGEPEPSVEETLVQIGGRTVRGAALPHGPASLEPPDSVSDSPRR